MAQQISARLLPGDTILLQGGIGAGKTHFARSLIQAVLEQPEDIPSPTYTLVQTYPTRIGEIWHADLYRLCHPDEVIELGLQEAFSEAICLVEWPDRLSDLTPENALDLHLELAENEEARIATLSWTTARWTAILEGLI